MIGLYRTEAHPRGDGHDGLRHGEKALRQRLHEIDKNEYLARHGKPARVEDLYAALLEHNRVNRIGRVRELPGRWKHLNPVLGSLVAAELTTDEIRHYIRKRQDAGAANATINRELATLKRMFNLGTECTPPKVRVVPHIPMLKEAKPRQGFVEDAEFSRLTAETSELWLRTFLELGFTYGWRHAELLGLRVRQVNLATGTIRLDVGTTKNGEGREVMMTAKVAELLREAVVGKSPESFVLTRRGKPISLQQSWRGLCIRAGLGSLLCLDCDAAVVARKRCKCGSHKREYRGLIPHDLRRSAAKAARRAGVAESVVMAMGGWKTASMSRRYAIVSSADEREAVN